MKSTPRTLCEIAKEVASEGYLDRARQRAARRKSPWNLLLIPLGLAGIAGTVYVLVQLMWRVHTLLYPSHVGRFHEFWGNGISAGVFVSSSLLVVPLFVAAIPLGMLLANIVAWFIPPARSAFAREAEGVEGASFRQATGELGKLALIIVPICLLLSGIGAATLSHLR
jgi:hypothetical protein